MKNIFLGLLLLCSVAVQAQSKKDKLIKKISGKVCDCIEKEKTDTMVTKAGYKALLSRCMMEPMLDNLSEITDAYKVREFNEEVGQKVGYDIGIYLAGNCPKFMDLTIKINSDEIKSSAGEPASTDTKSGTLQGTMSKTEQNGLVVFIVRESDGSEVRLWWYEKFDGDSYFTANPDAANGKKVDIEWTEKSIYMASQKEYVKIKSVKKITVSS